MAYKYHEAASIFPMMSKKERADLEADIQAHGLLEPIALFEGKILDGRNRYEACLAMGEKPKFVKVEPDDPVAYVRSHNQYRRHLNISQLGMVAARAQEWYRKRAKERQKQAGGDMKSAAARQKNASGHVASSARAAQSRDEVGKAFDVGGRTVGRAAKVIKEGSDELIQAVDAGEITVATASAVLDKPKDQQLQTAQERAERSKPVRGKLHPIRMGLQYARMAIAQLEKITKRDKERAQALDMVEQWIKDNR